MGHTPCARYIYLGFDSEVSCGCVNQICCWFAEAHQKRLSNVYRLAYRRLILIVPSIGNVIHRGVRQKKQKSVFGWEPWGT